MRSDRDGVEPEPLPRDWLPAALPPEGDAFWDAGIAGILVATELHTGTAVPSWLSEMGRWWQPTATLAAAAVVALLFVVAGSPPLESPGEPSDGLALMMIAADGDPVALWAALGVPADPVLALLTLQDHDAPVTPPAPTPDPGAPR